MQRLTWDQVENFFREFGCVVSAHPELDWYRESWHALEKEGLVTAEHFHDPKVSETVAKLRAICLSVMYLGIYQAAGEYGDLGGYFSDHQPFSWYLDSLSIEMDAIWTLAQHQEMLETDEASYWEDEAVEDKDLQEITMVLVSSETPSIYSALTEHYGGNVGLFVSIWNSRLPIEKRESLQNVVNSGHESSGKVAILSYVEGGMADWWWT